MPTPPCRGIAPTPGRATRSQCQQGAPRPATWAPVLLGPKPGTPGWQAPSGAPAHSTRANLQACAGLQLQHLPCGMGPTAVGGALPSHWGGAAALRACQRGHPAQCGPCNPMGGQHGLPALVAYSPPPSPTKLGKGRWGLAPQARRGAARPTTQHPCCFCYTGWCFAKLATALGTLAAMPTWQG